MLNTEELTVPSPDGEQIPALSENAPHSQICFPAGDERLLLEYSQD